MSKVGLATLIFLGGLSAACAEATETCRAHSGRQTGALLELYTSEGCSSCPPADKWMTAMATSADPARLTLLGFHVDYWDDIGWKDRFASHDYTLRQTARVRLGGGNTIYTPQVMLGSRLDQRWYQPKDIETAIRDQQARPSSISLDISATPHGSKIAADLKALPITAVSTSARLFLAIYQDGLISPVKAGENNGVTLRHDRVVRGLWGPWPVSSKGAARRLLITPPKSATLAQLGLTAFVQDARTGETLQALSLPLTGCAPP